MIKSKFDTFQFIGQFVITGFFFGLFFMFYTVFFGKKPVSLSSASGIVTISILVILVTYLLAQMKLNYKTVIIDTDLKVISFKMFILPITEKYELNQFDGYINTTVKDKYGDYKCFYLVTDGKLKYKMSGRFYSNIEELRSGLSSLKDMGFIKYTVPLSMRIALGKKII